MNEILQKRIEEAAKRYAWSHDTIGVDKETFHTESSQKAPIPIHNEVRVPIHHEMEVVFKCAAHFILNNLWISVEEALPDFQQDVVVTNSEGDYWTACRSNDKCEHKDNNGFVNYGIGEITHWMEIPSMK